MGGRSSRNSSGQCHKGIQKFAECQGSPLLDLLNSFARNSFDFAIVAADKDFAEEAFSRYTSTLHVHLLYQFRHHNFDRSSATLAPSPRLSWMGSGIQAFHQKTTESPNQISFCRRCIAFVIFANFAEKPKLMAHQQSSHFAPTPIFISVSHI